MSKKKLKQTEMFEEKKEVGVMIITPYNFSPLDYKGQIFKRPTMTVPDMTMSLTEILRRFAAGVPIEGIKAEIYNEEEEVPEVDKMDLADIEDMVGLMKLRRNEIVEEMKEKKKRAAEAAKPKVVKKAGAGEGSPEALAGIQEGGTTD